VTAANTQAPDGDRIKLRAIVTTIEREISHLAKPAATKAMDDLLVSWAELVNLLGLGAAPDLRLCPVCHHSGMRAATRCGFCWTRLAPLAEVDAGASQPPPAM
jgi:hypothetical protein